MAFVLIVDDEQMMAETVQEFLANDGLASAICTSGKDTLRFLEDHVVDVVLLDVNLPDMSGLVIAQKLKENMIDRDRFFSIIMVSAMDSSADKVAGLSHADDYVTKPFVHAELVARVKAHLRISQLQNELNISKKRYERLFDNMPEMCISLDYKKNITNCNTMFLDVFRMERSDVIGSSLFNFFREGEQERLELFLDSLAIHEVTDLKHNFTMAYYDRDGNPILVNIRAVCLGNKGESAVYTVISLKDVTRTVLLEKEQKAARQKLYRSARLASIGTLASGTAHQINNPLAAILGFSDALLVRFENREEWDEGEVLQYLRIIKEQTLRCRDVVDNLSKFASDYESESEKLSLVECIQSALMLMKPKADKKNIQIINPINNDIIIKTDAQKLGLVLVNVLTNSVEFCDDYSMITFGIDHENSNDKTVIVKISDNGPGIPEENLHKIFDPFFTTKEVGTGVGLGLSSSYKLMEESGGTIDIISDGRNGTTVLLEIEKT